MSDDGQAEGDRTAELWHGHDHNGGRRIEGVLHPDGRLTIDGRDVGEAVAFFGAEYSEYLFVWTAQAEVVPQIVALLGGAPGDDPLPLLTAWAQEHNGQDPGEFLRNGGVELHFWSRLD